MTSSRLFELPALTSLNVDHLCDLAVDFRAPLRIKTPVGLRMTYITEKGRLTGQINGELLEGGGDWAVIGTDGFGRLDVRGTVRTDDGVLLHFESRGVARLPADSRERLARGETIPWDESYIRTTPRFETANQRYAWLSGEVLISVSELSSDHIDYRIYRVL